MNFQERTQAFFEQYHEFLRDNVHGMLGKRKNVRIELKTDKKKQKIALNIETKSVKEFIEFITSIKENKRTVVNEIDGYRAMEVAHQILQKINSNLSTSQ